MYDYYDKAHSFTCKAFRVSMLACMQAADLEQRSPGNATLSFLHGLKTQNSKLNAHASDQHIQYMMLTLTVPTASFEDIW